MKGKTTTVLHVIECGNGHYVGDKFMHDNGVYVMSAILTPDGEAFALVNIGDGVAWNQGVMRYDEICTEIECCDFTQVASCEIKVHMPQV